MKKRAIAALVLASAMMLTACGGAATPAPAASSEAAPAASSEAAEPAAEAEAPAEEAPAWKPDGTVTIVCLSSAGGGSDNNTRAVIEEFSKIGVDTNFVVDYQNDGGGAVGWTNVAETKGDDQLLMCYGFGDVINQVDSSSPYGAANYKALAIVCSEGELMLQTPDCPYADFKEAVEAAKGGKVVTIAGSGGVDPLAYKQLLDVTGLTEDQMVYVRHNSTSEAIVTELGKHADYVVAKPSSCQSYVESGDLVPTLVFAQEHFPAPLDTAVTLEELGFENVDVAMWRGFAAPTTISDEAYAYYCDIFQQLVDSPEWTADYIEKYNSSPLFLIGEDAQAHMEKTEEQYKASVAE